MEWEIPEPLGIRPCQKPSDIKARQLNLYPVKLRKLPLWVDQAPFETSTINHNDQSQQTPMNQQNQTQNELYFTLNNKYKNKQKYTLVYERGEDKYQFNQNFSHQYIPLNFSNLEDHVQKQRKKQQAKINKQDLSQIDQKNLNNIYELEFDSRFQCGNLSRVYQVKNSNEYHLLMQNDINTLGYNQWYAFSVHNYENQPVKIKLKIVNFVKQKSLYKKGMKPWILSQNTKCWRQIKGFCSYLKTNVRSQSGDPYYQLDFEVILFPGLNYLAMMPIYSYSKLCLKIQKWQEIEGIKIYRKKVYSLCNNIVPILEYVPKKRKNSDSLLNEIDERNYETEENQEQNKSFETIVVFARIHPGQVWSSFLMEQLIDSVVQYYTSPNNLSIQRLRFLFIPMLNPDGVIYGNFRCDFSGVDLNRVWIQPSKFTECSIYQIKKILIKEFQIKKATYFMDLHSHSKLFNVFAYTSAENILESRFLSDLIRLEKDNQIFDPLKQIKSQTTLSIDFIKESQTTFLSSKQIFLSKKKSTARAFMSRLTEKGRSMTIQISFYGSMDKKNEEIKPNPFSIREFKNLSMTIVKKLHQILQPNQEVLKLRKGLQILYVNYQASLSQQHYGVHNSLKRQHRALSSEKQQVSEDSDSQPQKYYTNQTKKIIKSKNGQLHDCRIVTQREDKKSYMKQTQSMIKKAQLLKKDKNEKIQLAKNQANTQSKKQNVLKKPSISQYPMRAQSQRKKKQFKQKSIQINPDIDDNNIPGVQKHNMFRKKIIIQSRNKQKRPQVQSKNEGSDQKKQIMNNSVLDPAILELDDSKKYEPTFGQFLTKSKRSASRRYKTVTREEFSTYQAEISKIRKNDLRPNFMKKNKPQNAIWTFLQENMYVADVAYPKTEHHIDTKNIKTNQQAEQHRQSRNSSKKLNGFYQTKLKRNTGIERANNFKNIYMFQRKKIIQMMKKETRFCNEFQRQGHNFDQIQEIVDKRKRAKTQFDSFKTFYEQANIFYHNKMTKIQKP